MGHDTCKDVLDILASHPAFVIRFKNFTPSLRFIILRTYSIPTFAQVSLKKTSYIFS